MSEQRAASNFVNAHISQNTNMSHRPQGTDEERRARIRAETWKGSNKYLVMEAQRGKPWQNALKSNEPQHGPSQGPMSNSYGAPAVRTPAPMGTMPLVGLGQIRKGPVPSVVPIHPMPPAAHSSHVRLSGAVPGNGLPSSTPRAPRAFYAQSASLPPEHHHHQPPSPQVLHENWKRTGKERILLEADFEAEYQEMMDRMYLYKPKNH